MWIIEVKFREITIEGVKRISLSMNQQRLTKIGRKGEGGGLFQPIIEGISDWGHSLDKKKHCKPARQ